MVITTAGCGQENIAHDIVDYAQRVARGNIDDPGTLPATGCSRLRPKPSGAMKACGGTGYALLPYFVCPGDTDGGSIFDLAILDEAFFV